MNKLTLMAVATQPKYNDNDEWTGANISAHIEAEIGDGEQYGLHRIGIKLEITPTLANAVKEYGYDERTDRYLMKRVEACLGVCKREWNGVEKDADNICEVIHQKMLLFLLKSADRIFYSQNFRTGEIDECTEDMLDRNVKNKEL